MPLFCQVLVAVLAIFDDQGLGLGLGLAHNVHGEVIGLVLVLEAALLDVIVIQEAAHVGILVQFTMIMKTIIIARGHTTDAVALMSKTVALMNETAALMSEIVL